MFVVSSHFRHEGHSTVLLVTCSALTIDYPLYDVWLCCDCRAVAGERDIVGCTCVSGRPSRILHLWQAQSVQ